jgi:hypothetical protein
VDEKVTISFLTFVGRSRRSELIERDEGGAASREAGELSTLVS